MRVFGQEEALESLAFGLQIADGGFSVAVTGPKGSGRETAVRALLDRIASAKAPPPDRVAISNPEEPEKPLLLELPPGTAAAFKNALDAFAGRFEEELPLAVGGGEAAERKQRLEAEITSSIFDRKAAYDSETAKISLDPQGRIGISVVMQEGAEPGMFELFAVPTLDGQPLMDEAPEAAFKEEKLKDSYWKAAMAEFDQRVPQVMEPYTALLHEFQSQGPEVSRRIAEIERRAAEDLVGRLGDDLLKTLPAGEARDRVRALLDRAAKDYRSFLPAPDGSRERPAESLRADVLASGAAAPVVVEHDPSEERLFGGLEPVFKKSNGMPALGAKVVSGSFQKANGGFLVLRLSDLLREEGSFGRVLKALRTGNAAIKSLDMNGAKRSLDFPARVKVVLIAEDDDISLVEEAAGGEFSDLFRSRAEFKEETSASPKAIRDYLSFMKASVSQAASGLLDFDRGAIAALLEFGAALSGGNRKLSLRLSEILTLMREASSWAGAYGRAAATRLDVEKALDFRRRSTGEGRRRARERLLENEELVATEGFVAGQANGLVVAGDYGLPARLTARVSFGDKGVVSLDRGAQLTGPIFDKAVGVVEMFLKAELARKGPLPVDLGLSFEQNYGPIDGDSATSTKIYAALSALSGFGIDQGIAVTGSADQFGNLQAIGGVNLKIEGFFDLAEARGLNGRQGVIIPSANLDHLMLEPRIVEAVRKGLFHVWAVDHVGQAIELLTGRAYSEVLDAARSRWKM
jgi:predicted ATP-dependent protease